MTKCTDDQRDAFMYSIMGRVAAKRYNSYQDWKDGRNRMNILTNKVQDVLIKKADEMAADMLSGKPIYYGIDLSDSQKKDQDFVRWINRNKPSTRHTSNPAVDIKWPDMKLRLGRTSTSDVKDFNKSLRQDIEEICADVVDAGWTLEMMVAEIAKHVKP